jgi:hypothetical protein
MMAGQKGIRMNLILEVVWTLGRRVEYPVDADKWSRAHDELDFVTLECAEGVYLFYKETGRVILDDGKRHFVVPVVRWRLVEDE